MVQVETGDSDLGAFPIKVAKMKDPRTLWSKDQKTRRLLPQKESYDPYKSFRIGAQLGHVVY